MLTTPQSHDCVSPKPIVKWVGGKSRVVPQLLPLLPRNLESLRHVEPFAGGAALFFALRPSRALLGDINQSLCETYEAVRDCVDDVLGELVRLASTHSKTQYYEIRAAYNCGAPSAGALRAAQFIYLNKTCFNGVHRLNRRGEFNVPVGDVLTPWRVDQEAMRAASAELGRAELRAQSFERLLESAGDGDFVYCDPPYDVNQGTRNFVGYNREPFGSDAQDALRDMLVELDRRGCKLMLSNSDTRANWRRYSDFSITTILATRPVNSDARGRGAVRELVIRNYA